MLVPYKFIIQAVLIEMEDGKPTGEAVSDPVTLFGTPALKEWAGQFEAELEKVNADRATQPAQSG